MNISPEETTSQVKAVDVRFVDDTLYVTLDDGREVSLSIKGFDWLDWLADASLEQRDNWSIEPGGFAVYWEDLDDGIEIKHLLRMQPSA